MMNEMLTSASPPTAWRILTLAACLMTAGCANLRPYAGQWVLRSDGKNLMVLKTEVHHHRLVGELTEPIHLEEDAQGVFHGVSKPIQTFAITGQRQGNGIKLVVQESSDKETMPARLSGKDYLFLARFHGIVPDFRFARVASSPGIEVADDWPNYNSDPKIVSIRETLRQYARKDQSARDKASISDAETRALSEECSDFLRSVFDAFGWPKTSVFGYRAAQDYWLLLQHQPASFQKTLLVPLKGAVDAGEAPFSNYAETFDRIEIAEGRPQHWGTQATCVRGKAILNPVDDMANLERLRRDAGLADIALSLKQSDAICARVPH